ncbi:hypothetical protein ACWF50_13205 [Brucella pseudogrignonensis]
MINEKIDLEYRWCKIMEAGRHRTFDSSAEGNDVLALQERYYKQILEVVSDLRTPSESTSLDLWEVISPHTEIIFSSSKLIAGDKKFHVKSILPVITLNDVTTISDLFKRLVDGFGDLLDLKASSYFVAAGVYVEARERLPSSISFDHRSRKELIYFASSRYLSMKNIISFNEDSRNNVSSHMENFKRELEEKLAESTNTFLDLSASYINASKNVEKLQSSTNEMSENLRNDLAKAREEIENFGSMFDAQKSTLEQRLELNALGGLWASVANRSKWATIFTSFIIVALAGFGVFVAFWWGGEIVDFIVEHQGSSSGVVGADARSNDGWIGLQISRIFIVTVPTLLYIWVIKLTVRFLFRSLALYDDAVQRKTIMDSYFMLSERNAVDEKILPLIIWALCRQVPGHGHDGIDPPDFSEVINAGLNFGKKSP